MERMNVWTFVWLLTNVPINWMQSVMAELDPAAMIYNTEDREKYAIKEPSNLIVNVSRCPPNMIGRYVVRAFGNYTDDPQINEKRKSNPTLEKYNVCQHSNEDKEKMVYRNPEYIWGKEYTTNVTKQVCEACILARGNEAKIIRFTKRGMSTCSKLCVKMDLNILRVWPTSVMLKDYYCTKKVLKPAKCVCVFKISCQEYNNFMFINLIPDRKGDVAILYYEVENS